MNSGLLKTTTALLSLAWASSMAASAPQGCEIVFTINKAEPTLDRWMYPFNQTPGYRTAGSIFGYWSYNFADGFDVRDAQIVLGFDVSEDYDPTQCECLQVVSAKVTIQIANNAIFYDDTIDDWRCFLPPNDPNYVPDEDINQPMELTGVAYRAGFTNETWTEGAPFAVAETGQPFAPRSRTAYSMVFRDGVPTDCSNSFRENWNPEPFAIGKVDGLQPGDAVPVDSVFEFDVNVADDNIQEYLRQQVSEGDVRFVLNSMKQAFQDGGNFPSFYLRENPAVLFGVASAATLELVLDTTCEEPVCPADFNGDGVVNGIDLAQLLGRWGNVDAEFDLDGDGVIGGADLAFLLGCWTT